MGKPYDLYIRFLVTKGLTTHEEVNDKLDEFNLKHISADEFDKQYAVVHDHVPKPIADQIVNKRYEGNSFLRYMGILQVKELWEMEKGFDSPETKKLRLIYDIHNDAPMRLTINALLIKGSETPDIVQDINMKYAYMIKDAHVELYKKFFCNPSLMLRKDWKKYLPLVDGEERLILFTALSEPLDALKTALDLPSRLDISGSLQNLLVGSFQKAKHYMKSNSVEANREARAWIKTVLEVSDKHQKYSKADIGDFSKSIQMEFDYVSNDFVSPDEILMRELRAKNAPKVEE